MRFLIDIVGNACENLSILNFIILYHVAGQMGLRLFKKLTGNRLSIINYSRAILVDQDRKERAELMEKT